MVMTDGPLTAEDHMRLSQAIQRAESGTSGEIFVVVAASAEDYRLWGTVWAALLALLTPWPLTLTSLALPWILVIQAGVFVLAALVMGQPDLAVRLTPMGVRKGAVRDKAREQFLAHGIHTTEDRTGVLIFVSLAERSVEVIADTGIYALASPSIWDRAVAEITTAAKAGRLVEGIEAAIGHTGAALSEHWPPRSHDGNELPDHITVL
jgi:putative membrane protein